MTTKNKVLGINEHGVATDREIALRVEIDKMEFQISYLRLSDGRFIFGYSAETRTGGCGGAPSIHNEHFENFKDGLSHELNKMLEYFKVDVVNRHDQPDIILNAKKMVAEINKRLQPQLQLF